MRRLIAKFKLCVRRAVARKRNIMRGHAMLEKAGDLEKHYRIREKIIRIPPFGPQAGPPPGFLPFKSADMNREIYNRALLQFTFKLVGWARLTPILHNHTATGTPLVYPVPAAWQVVLEEEGFKVRKIACQLFFKLLSLYFLIRGVRRFLSISGKTLVRLPSRTAMLKSRIAQPHLHVFDIGPQNLPVKHPAGASFDLISWLRDRWGGGKRDLDVSVGFGLENCTDRDLYRIHHRPAGLPPISSVAGLARFFGWGVVQSLLALIYWMVGRNGPALLFEEAALCANFRLADRCDLASHYVFNNAAHAYRPLWTREAESRGAEIIFLFYSTNNEYFIRHKTISDVAPSWQLLCWPNYLVYDSQQANFVERAVSTDATISKVGPVWFCDNAEPVEIEKQFQGKKLLAVFDVQPFRPSTIPNIGQPFYYYNAETCVRFLSDIADVCEEFGWVPVLKGKRNIGRIMHSRYAKLRKDLMASGRLILLDQGIAPQRVIEVSNAVVSIPFTSTAHIANAMNVPGCYYDALGQVGVDTWKQGETGLIVGPQALRRWFSDATSGCAK